MPTHLYLDHGGDPASGRAPYDPTGHPAPTTAQLRMINRLTVVGLEIRTTPEGYVEAWGWRTPPWSFGPKNYSGLIKKAMLFLDPDGLAVSRVSYSYGNDLGLRAQDVDALNLGADHRWEVWLLHLGARVARYRAQS